MPRRKGLQEDEGDPEVGGANRHPRQLRDDTRAYHTPPGQRRSSWPTQSLRELTETPVLYDSSDIVASSPAASHNFGTQSQSPACSSLVPGSIQVDSGIPPTNLGWGGDAEDNEIPVGDITDTRVIEAFTQDEMADRLRRQLRSQVQLELQANAVTAEVIEPTVDRPIFRMKRRVLVLVILFLVVTAGIVAGVVIAILGKTLPEEDYLDGVTITGTNNGDNFGSSIAISRDASTLASAARKGHYVQVFRWDDRKEWHQVGQKLDDFEYQHDDHLQANLDLSADGSVLALGQWNNDDAGTNAGFAIVYWFNGTDWTKLGEPLVGNAPKDQFGYSVALSDDGSTIGVGSSLGHSSSNLKDTGYVRVFTFNGTFAGGQSVGQWLQLGSDLEGQTEQDQFGVSLALSADGRRIAVGANGGSSKKGIVRVFDYSAESNDWTQVGNLIEGHNENDGANKVTMSADGSLLVIAAGEFTVNAISEGYGRTYKLDGCCTWRQLGSDLLGISRRIALSSDGTCLAVGMYAHENEQGRGELFSWNGADSIWNQVAVTTGDKPGDRLGVSVAITGNCSLFALGATSLHTSGTGYIRLYSVP